MDIFAGISCYTNSDFDLRMELDEKSEDFRRTVEENKCKGCHPIVDEIFHKTYIDLKVAKEEE